jgi:hypothetical protein
MKINHDLAALLIAIPFACFFIYIGYLGIFYPMKIISFYSKDSTPFLRRVRAEGLSNLDLLQYRLTGILCIALGFIVLLICLLVSIGE